MISLKNDKVSADLLMLCLRCELELLWAKQRIAHPDPHYSLSYANTGMQMLKSAVESGTKLLHELVNLEDLTFDIEAFQSQCQEARSELEACHNAKWKEVGAAYCLGATEPLGDEYELRFDLSFNMEFNTPDFFSDGNRNVLLRRTRANINMFPLLSLDASLEEACAWIQSMPKQQHDSFVRDYFIINSTEQDWLE
jgi:hypothetical protein